MTNAVLPARSTSRRESELRARWCCAEVWREDHGDEPGGFVICGGERRHARRVEGEFIVTYLMCLICRSMTKQMTYNMETAAVTICEEEQHG